MKGAAAVRSELCNFAMQDSFNYVLSMPTKFDVWMGEKHLTFFYSSGNKFWQYRAVDISKDRDLSDSWDLPGIGAIFCGPGTG